jgi:hypothetical protein
MDPGSAINVIDQKLALELGLPRIEGASTPTIEFLNGVATAYGAYEVTIRAQDSRGLVRKVTNTFYGVAIDSEPKLLVGMPTLDSSKIALVGGNPRSWHWNVAKFELLSPKEFHSEIENGSLCYAVVPRAPTISRRIRRAMIRSLKTSPSKVKAFLEQYRDVLSPSEEALSIPCEGVYHRIETTGEPPHGPIYNLSQTELKALREYLDEALKQGWVQASQSPAGAPILFVPKSDGTLRLCVDYRGLNKITKKNRYPLPLISEILDRLSGAKVFSKLDLVNAYHRIAIHPDDVWKTAFRTRYGHYEYRVMPFGLTNAPATFQAWIHKALAEYLDDFVVVYLDDILIYSDSPEEHQIHLEKVLKRLRQYSLYCKESKCHFYQTQVEFLGYIVTPEGVKMDESRITSIKEWPEPKSYANVQQFLGFCNFYRRFIQHYSAITAPMTALLKGSVRGIQHALWRWPPEAQDAFETLREAFTRAPLLMHYDPAKRCRVDTDASGVALAAILSQQDAAGNWHPVAFWSRKLTDVETRYGTHDQELMAIVASFKHWRHYLEGVSETTIVYSDHRNLSTFMNMRELNGRQARWAMKLAGFDLEIRHQPGKRNPADAPSRRPDYVSESTPNTHRLPLEFLQSQLGLSAPRGLSGASKRVGVMVGRVLIRRVVTEADGQSYPVLSVATQKVSRTKARDAARDLDPYGEEPWMLKELLRSVQKDDPMVISVRGDLDAEVIRGVTEKESLEMWSVRDGLLYRSGALYVPKVESICQELMRRHHDDPLAGHFGIEKTLELLQRKYYWETLKQDVKEYVSTCPVCQRMKPRRHKPYGLLKPLPEPRAAWSDITMDFITDLPPSRRGRNVYDSILVIVDRKTKMSLYVPCDKKCDAEELAHLLVERVISRFGTPDSIVSDRGPIFTSNFWSEVCYITKIKKRLSTAFHPQTDGQTERQNQTLIHWLRCYVDEQQSNWAGLLPLAEFAYNNSYHASIKMSPFRALYGSDLDLDIRVDDNVTVQSLRERWTTIKELQEKATTEWSKTKARMSEYANKHRQDKTFKKDEKVLLNTKNLKLRTPKKKLSARFCGPFVIVEPIGTNAYRLELPVGWRVHDVFNVEYLEPYKEREGSEADLMPPPEVWDEEEHYEIEEVLNKKGNGRNLKYLVKWKGWNSIYNQWLPNSELDNARDAVQKFEDTEADHPRTRGRPTKETRRSLRNTK